MVPRSNGNDENTLRLETDTPHTARERKKNCTEKEFFAKDETSWSRELKYIRRKPRWEREERQEEAQNAWTSSSGSGRDHDKVPDLAAEWETSVGNLEVGGVDVDSTIGDVQTRQLVSGGIELGLLGLRLPTTLWNSCQRWGNELLHARSEPEKALLELGEYTWYPVTDYP